MKPKAALKARKHKKRLRRLNLSQIPQTMTISTSSPSNVLATAYPISIYWDNELDAFIAELSDFNNAQVHASTWQAAAAAAQTAQQLLIEAYRLYGYTLPEV